MESKEIRIDSKIGGGIIVHGEDCCILYISGQTGIVPDTGKVVEGGISAQTIQALENLRSVIEDSNGRLEDIVDVTIFIKGIWANLEGFEKSYGEVFTYYKPSRTVVEVSEILPLEEDTMVEIKAVAYIPHHKLK